MQSFQFTNERGEPIQADEPTVGVFRAKHLSQTKRAAYLHATGLAA